jgi:hypothetical protein
MYTLATTVSTPVTTTTNVAISSNNLTVADTGSKNDALTITADTTNSQWVISDATNYIGTAISNASGNGTHTVNVPFADVTGSQVNVTTLGGNDSITINGTTKAISLDAGTGTDTINIVDAGSSTPVTIVPSSGGDAVNVNTDNVGTAFVTLSGNPTLGNLSIGAGGQVTMPANGNNTLRLTGLSLVGIAKLDLNDNDLALDYTGSSSPYSQLVSWMSTGMGGVAGITSSVRDSSGASTVLAMVDNALVGVSDWPVGSGQSVSANAILGKYTYFGDVNLSGSVDDSDYAVVDGNYGVTPPLGEQWLMGDANMSGGPIDDSDYAVIDGNFGDGVSNPLSPASIQTVASMTTTTVAPVDKQQDDSAASMLFSDTPLLG